MKRARPETAAPFAFRQCARSDILISRCRFSATLQCLQSAIFRVAGIRTGMHAPLSKKSLRLLPPLPSFGRVVVKV